MSAVAETIALPPMTGPQMHMLRIHERDERCWDVEGSPRSAKSWGIGFWIWLLAYTFPGIQVFYARYKDESLAQLRDVWAKVSVYFPPYLHPKWNTKDQAWDFPNGRWIGEVYTGSRVYCSSIKSSDTEAVHSKYKGKTLAVVVVEEAQELPRVNYLGLKERLSQSRTPDGTPFRYPLKIVLVHNCVDLDHWIAEEFPLGADGETCAKPHHAHLRADLYSNAQNLGPDVIDGYERDYPEGHPLRRTVIEGKRGVTLIGTPVYGRTFKRPIHLSDTVTYAPHYPILEGWDFGEEKPAVVWMQYLRHIAAVRILGAVKGAEIFLELFAPRVLEIRARLFPSSARILSWCDPTGATGNGGMAYNPVALLKQLGVAAQPAKDASSARDGNDMEVRNRAIQTLAGYMLRSAVDGSPAFQMAPTCIELVRHGTDDVVEQDSHVFATAFEAGYIWDTKVASDEKPNIRKPKKGTRYDDLMNAAEYCVVGHGIPLLQSTVMLARAQRLHREAPAREEARATVQAQLALRRQQKDDHPEDAKGARQLVIAGQARPRAGRRSFY